MYSALATNVMMRVMVMVCARDKTWRPEIIYVYISKYSIHYIVHIVKYMNASVEFVNSVRMKLILHINSGAKLRVFWWHLCACMYKCDGGSHSQQQALDTTYKNMAGEMDTKAILPRQIGYSRKIGKFALFNELITYHKLTVNTVRPD